jgi:adenosyl cobinamide kinase/adenosyl cobinamide phosphate guanylyltransferase
VITLVLGGTRSGKSDVAERLAAGLGDDVIYVATGTVTDEGMAERIARHRARRPAAWTTVEAGADLVGALRTVRPDGVVLVDSLGTWLAQDLDAADAAALCAALTGRRGPTVVVSEEVGLGVHSSSDVGRRFADALGALNRSVADIADEVLLVIAGRVLPLQ